MAPHPLTLRFAAPYLEAAFQADYTRRSLVLVRWALLLGIVQYAGYGLLDRWMVPVATGQVRAVRVAVCAVIALGLLGTFAPRFFRRWMQAVVVVPPAVAALGVAAMAWLAQSSEMYYHYHAGVMLTLFYVHVLLRVRFVVAAAAGSVMVVAYLAVVAATAIPTPMLANSAFFLLTTHFCGMVASYALERYDRLRFVQVRRQERSNRELADTLDDLRAAQTRLVQQEKMASLGRMTAGVAHEIKNPLNFVVNFAGLNRDLLQELRDELAAAPARPVGEALTDAGGLFDDLRTNAEKIAEHGARADGIVRAMLAHARGGSAVLVAADLNALVAEQAALAFHSARARDDGFACALTQELDPAAGLVRCAPQEIGRVLQNLLGNAFYAVAERSRERPGGDGAYAPAVAVRTRRAGEAVVVEVEDNGAGIPEAIREHVFEPFFTTKPTGTGTGLGLSLAYDIVQSHGGTLAFESAAGRGTRFVLTLPLEAPAVPA
jgi:signal transduction histidine kinase